MSLFMYCEKGNIELKNLRGCIVRIDDIITSIKKEWRKHDSRRNY